MSCALLQIVKTTKRCLLTCLLFCVVAAARFYRLYHSRYTHLTLLFCPEQTNKFLRDIWTKQVGALRLRCDGAWDRPARYFLKLCGICWLSFGIYLCGAHQRRWPIWYGCRPSIEQNLGAKVLFIAFYTFNFVIALLSVVVYCLARSLEI